MKDLVTVRNSGLKQFPVCVCGKVSMGRVVTPKPVLPSKEETEENKRAKSAKLRVFERTEKKDEKA